MAMQLIEGFESGIGKKSLAYGVSSTPTGVFGYGLAFGGNLRWTAPPAGVAKPILGYHYNPPGSIPSGSNSARAMLEVRDINGVSHVSLFYTTAGFIQLVRGAPTSGVVLATSSIVMPFGQWNWIEHSCTIDDTTGTFILKINGATVINFTGDTKNAGTSTQVLDVLLHQSGTAVLYDNLYIADGTGAAPYNDFLGESKIETIRPNGNGNSSQLVGSDGNSTDNYLLVNEVTPSVVNYAGSATAGNKDTYAMANLVTSSGSVLGVQTSILAFKSDAGAATMKTVERIASGTERDSAAQTLVATPGAWINNGVQIVDPDNNAWTITSVNAMEAGAKVG